MLSIPPATTIWEFPVWIACCASATAFSPDQIGQAKTPARLLKKVGSVGHALHSASDNDLGVPCLDRLLCERDCLQPRAANFVDGHGADAVRQPASERSLTRRVLAQPG